MGKSFGFLALAVLAGITMPSFAIAAPVDTQQQIIAQKEEKPVPLHSEITGEDL